MGATMPSTLLAHSIPYLNSVSHLSQVQSKNTCLLTPPPNQYTVLFTTCLQYYK